MMERRLILRVNSAFSSCCQLYILRIPCRKDDLTLGVVSSYLYEKLLLIKGEVTSGQIISSFLGGGGRRNFFYWIHHA